VVTNAEQGPPLRASVAAFFVVQSPPAEALTDRQKKLRRRARNGVSRRRLLL